MGQRTPENALVSCAKKVYFFCGLFHLFCFDLFKRRHYLMVLVKSNEIFLFAIIMRIKGSLGPNA